MTEDRVNDAIARLRNLRDPAWEETPASVRLILHLKDARGYYVGEELVALDRELRRAVQTQKSGLSLLGQSLTYGMTYLGSEEENRGETKRAQGGPKGARPVNPDEASLRLLAAEPGSAHLFLEPLGALVDILASDPVEALVAALALSGTVGKVRVWGRRMRARLVSGEPHEIMQLLASEDPEDREYELGRADSDIEVGTENVHVRVRSTRRVTVLITYGNGETTLVEAGSDD